MIAAAVIVALATTAVLLGVRLRNRNRRTRSTAALSYLSEWTLEQLAVVREPLHGMAPPRNPAPLDFVPDSLLHISKVVTADPDQAFELTLDLADFIRYRSRQFDEFALLSDELRCVDQYLTLVRARLGDELEVDLDIAAGALSAKVPFLCLQSLVENALRYGRGPDGWRLKIEVSETVSDTRFAVSDEGPGVATKRTFQETLMGRSPASYVVLDELDRRIHGHYGDEYGLIVETAPGAGTKVCVIVPRVQPPAT